MDESAKISRIEVQGIDHLGIVAGIVDEIGLVEDIETTEVGTAKDFRVAPQLRASPRPTTRE